MAAGGCGLWEGEGVMGANLSPASRSVAGDPGAGGPWRRARCSGQAGPVRLRWFLALTAALAVTIAATVVIYDRVEGFNAPSDQVVGSPSGTAGDPSEGDGADAPRTEVPASGAPGTFEVEGLLTAVHLEGAVLQPRLLPTPLTLVSSRGFGNGGEVTGVVVGGEASAVVWDGGTPFVLASGPGLVLDPVSVDLGPDGLRAILGSGVHALEQGEYRLDTPVAVGQAGVATPYDAVRFTATADAQLEASGDTALVLDGAGPWRFVGPGLVHLEGELLVDRPEGAQTATVLDLREGPYELELAPLEGGGWSVTGRIQSSVVGDLTLG